MQNSEEIKELVTGIAVNDDRIRAVLLNGSRANYKIAPDKYQDYDIVFIVTNIGSFTLDHSWIKIFGEKLIGQLPDEMILDINEEKNSAGFHYLMLLKDGNRIDLTLFPMDRIKDQFRLESLALTWLDKDNLFQGIGEPSDSDHWIKKPGQKQFSDVCNEFWWVSTNVAKGLLRKEITYSKEMLERFVRPMFMKIVEWYIGTNTGFSVSVGKGGKFMKNYLPQPVYEKILETYSDYHVANNWQALFIMMELFGTLAAATADSLGFQYNVAEQENVSNYLKDLYKEQGQ